eukprot:scaffold8204_cov248-Pinguiococcus_pyrenoidosus.AAC.4
MLPETSVVVGRRGRLPCVSGRLRSLPLGFFRGAGVPIVVVVEEITVVSVLPLVLPLRNRFRGELRKVLPGAQAMPAFPDAQPMSTRRRASQRPRRSLPRIVLQQGIADGPGALGEAAGILQRLGPIAVIQDALEDQVLRVRLKRRLPS